MHKFGVRAMQPPLGSVILRNIPGRQHGLLTALGVNAKSWPDATIGPQPVSIINCHCQTTPGPKSYVNVVVLLMENVPEYATDIDAAALPETEPEAPIPNAVNPAETDAVTDAPKVFVSDTVCEYFIPS